jgi:hypothetical protein
MPRARSEAVEAWRRQRVRSEFTANDDEHPGCGTLYVDARVSAHPKTTKAAVMTPIYVRGSVPTYSRPAAAELHKR